MFLLAILAKDLRALVAANFFYSDGDALFGYGYLQATRLDRQNKAQDLWASQSHRTLAHADLA